MANTEEEDHWASHPWGNMAEYLDSDEYAVRNLSCAPLSKVVTMNGPPGTPFPCNDSRPLKPRKQNDGSQPSLVDVVRKMGTLEKVKAKWTRKISSRAPGHDLPDIPENSQLIQSSAAGILGITPLVVMPEPLLAGFVGDADARSIPSAQNEGRTISLPLEVSFHGSHQADSRSGPQLEASTESSSELAEDNATQRSSSEFDYSLSDEVGSDDFEEEGDTPHIYEEDSESADSSEVEHKFTFESITAPVAIPTEGNFHGDPFGNGNDKDKEEQFLTLSSVARLLGGGDREENGLWAEYLHAYHTGQYNANNPPQPQLLCPIDYLPAVYPHNEPARYSAYRQLADLWTPLDAQKALVLANNAVKHFGVDHAAVSFFDENLEVRMAETIHSDDDMEIDLNRRLSLAAHALYSTDVLAVLDTSEDWRFMRNPAVIGWPEIRFFAAAPMIADEKIIGTFTIFDKAPRDNFGHEGRKKLAEYSELATARLINEYKKMCSPDNYQPTVVDQDSNDEMTPTPMPRVNKSRSQVSFNLHARGDNYCTPLSSSEDSRHFDQGTQANRPRQQKPSGTVISFTALPRTSSTSNVTHKAVNSNVGPWGQRRREQESLDLGTPGTISEFYNLEDKDVFEEVIEHDTAEQKVAYPGPPPAYPLPTVPQKTQVQFDSQSRPTSTSSSAYSRQSTILEKPQVPPGNASLQTKSLDVKMDIKTPTSILASLAAFRREICPFISNPKLEDTDAKHSKPKATTSRTGSIFGTLRSKISVSTMRAPHNSVQSLGGGYTIIQPNWGPNDVSGDTSVLWMSSSVPNLKNASDFRVDMISTCLCRQIATKLGYDIVYVATVIPKHSVLTGEILKDENLVTSILAVYPENHRVQLHQERHSIPLTDGPQFVDNLSRQFVAGDYRWGIVVPLQQLTPGASQSIGAVLGAFSKTPSKAIELGKAIGLLRSATEPIIADLAGRVARMQKTAALMRDPRESSEQQQPVVNQRDLQEIRDEMARLSDRQSISSNPYAQGLGLATPNEQQDLAYQAESISPIQMPLTMKPQHGRMVPETEPVYQDSLQNRIPRAPPNKPIHRPSMHDRILRERIVPQTEPIRHASLNDRYPRAPRLPPNKPIYQPSMHDRIQRERTEPQPESSYQKHRTKETIERQKRRDGNGPPTFAQTIRHASMTGYREETIPQPEHFREGYKRGSEPIERDVLSSPEVADQFFREVGMFRNSGSMTSGDAGSLKQRESIERRYAPAVLESREEYAPDRVARQRIAERFPARDRPLRMAPGRHY